MSGQARDFTAIHHAAVARYRAETRAPYKEIAEKAAAEGLYGVEFPREPSESALQLWCSRAAERARPESYIERIFIIADSVLTLELPERDGNAEKVLSLLKQALPLAERAERLARQSRERHPPKTEETNAESAPDDPAPSITRLSKMASVGPAIANADSEPATREPVSSTLPVAQTVT